MHEDYKGKFITEEEFNSSDWHEYYVYKCEGGYRVWTFEPLKCEVEGMERI